MLNSLTLQVTNRTKIRNRDPYFEEVVLERKKIMTSFPKEMLNFLRDIQTPEFLPNNIINTHRSGRIRRPNHIKALKHMISRLNCKLS
jgi:hypothetical protein